MASNLRVTATFANAMLTAALTLANSGTLVIYAGTQPASGGGSTTGSTELVQFPLGLTAFQNPSNGVASANPIVAAVASAAGTASWFRILSSGGTPLLDGSVGTTGCDLNLATTTINSGDVLAITAFTATETVS